MNCTCGVCKFTKIWFCTCKSTRFFVSCRQDGEQMFFQVQILGTNNLFCLQNNVFVTLLHATQKLKRHFEARIFSLPQMVFIVQSKFIWGPSPLCAIYWHSFPRDQPQPGFFFEARERTLGTRLSELYNVSWWYYTLVIEPIGQLRRDFVDVTISRRSFVFGQLRAKV